MSNRDELAEMTAGADTLAWDIFRADNSNIPEDQLRADFPPEAEYAIHIAKHLRAAGYRKMELGEVAARFVDAELRSKGWIKPRTVTTAEELDALPVDSVVGDWIGRVYQKDAEEEAPEFPWWMTPGDQRRYPAKRITLPATVLYEPTP